MLKRKQCSGSCPSECPAWSRKVRNIASQSKLAIKTWEKLQAADQRSRRVAQAGRQHLSPNLQKAPKHKSHLGGPQLPGHGSLDPLDEVSRTHKSSSLVTVLCYLRLELTFDFCGHSSIPGVVQRWQLQGDWFFQCGPCMSCQSASFCLRTHTHTHTPWPVMFNAYCLHLNPKPKSRTAQMQHWRNINLPINPQPIRTPQLCKLRTLNGEVVLLFPFSLAFFLLGNPEFPRGYNVKPLSF